MTLIRADAITMSMHGRGASRFLLGSVADKVLRGSGLPMLLRRPIAVTGEIDAGRTATASAAVADAVARW
jgi:hypothetical protein